MAATTDPLVPKARASAMRDARLCLHPSPDGLMQLRQGTKRLQVSVHAYAPPKPATGTIVLWLLAGKQRHEITRFAVHPMRAFTAQQPERSQHFDVALDEHAALIASNQPLCFAVGFDRTAAKYSGGLLEVSIHS